MTGTLISEKTDATTSATVITLPPPITTISSADATDILISGITVFPVREIEKPDVIVIDIDKDNDDPTIIYRSGSGNGTNLTPREADVTGLSYFTTVDPAWTNYTETTVGAVNSTGVLEAYNDHGNHYLVRPTDESTMDDWIASRPNALVNPHVYTIILTNISKKTKK